MSSAAPSDCGRRLLTHLIDERAASNHPRPFYSLPKTNDPADGFEDLSYAGFADAVNKLAKWITREIGTSTTFETLVFIGPADLRYQILVMAAVETGYVMFLPSPRNSLEAFESLLDSCKATRFLTTSDPYPIVETLIRRRSMDRLVIPELRYLLDSTESVEHVPFTKTWQEARMDPFVQVHTSGSTGTPKLQTLRHGNFCCIDAFQSVEPNDIGLRQGNQRTFCPFPPFHVAGLLYNLTVPAWADATIVLSPVVPITADMVNSVHIHGKVEFSTLIPSVVVELAGNEEYLNNLSRLNGLNYAGGPLPDSVGHKVKTRTKLMTNIGSTEYQAVPMWPSPWDYWPYFRFHHEAIGMEFQEREAGLYEMVFIRKPELDLVQSIFITFPELQEYHTKDLFAKDPARPHCWKYVSRLDDIIVMSSGENLNPVSMESTIAASAFVKGALVIGQGRRHPVCLIEPQTHDNMEKLLDSIWPVVEKANANEISHGKISKDWVFFTSADKPLPRASKGTIQRAAANTMYALEIDRFYESLKTLIPKSHIRIDLTSVETTRCTLKEFLKGVVDIPDLEEEDDLIACGMDSMQVIRLMRTINSALPENHPIDAKQIYDNPTIRRLADSLHMQAKVVPAYDWETDEDAQKEAWLEMDRIYEDFVVAHGKTTERHGWFRLKSLNSGPVFPPDGGSVAWLQVVASFLINVNNWGLVNSFGVFQAYYQSGPLAKHSALSIAFVGTLQGALLLIIGFISGPLFDAGYFRFLLVVASSGLVLSLMMLSLATQYYQIFLAQGLLLGICGGLLYIPSVAVIPVYFKTRRGLALGIATGGGSVGGVIYPIVFRRLLSSLGFPWAVRCMGFIALATLVVAVLITKPLGPRSRRQLIDLAAFKDIPYLSFMTAAFLSFAAVLVPFFLASSFASTKLHASNDMAFYIIAIFNAAQFFGRLLPSWLTDFHPRFFGPEILVMLAELTAGVLGFTWILVHNMAGFIPWAVVYSFASGMLATLPATVLPYICPNLAIYGTRLGMVYGAAGLGFLISTPVAAALDAHTQGILGAQLWTGACSLGAVALFGIAGVEARKRRLLFEHGQSKRKIELNLA